ncbi:MAG: transcription-repair coupling factor [Chloroflexi bacterium]|nr:transcription-repair coupling factor [Chloroflexota bacterium]MDA1228314.1 transcription-repair coupling factor [Chloroflexota bacterium]
MSLSVLGSMLESAPQYQRLEESLKKSRVRARAQVLSNAVPFTLSTIWRRLQHPMLVVTPKPEDARRVHEQLINWIGDDSMVLHFQESEILPFERLASDRETVHQRLRTLSAMSNQNGQAPIIVASTAAVAQKTLAKETFSFRSHSITKGQQIDLDDMLDQWRRMGYDFESAVYGPGTVSRRGGIIDIFPIGADRPSRIELWGNEIDSIRHFEPSTQRSTDIVESIDIIPADEILPGLTSFEELDRMMAFIDVANCTEQARERIREEFDLLLDGQQVDDLGFYAGFFNRGSLLDYFASDGIVVMYKPSEIEGAAWDLEERSHQLRENKEQRGELPANFPSSHLIWHDITQAIETFDRVLELTPWGAEDLDYHDAIVLPFSSPPSYFGKLDSFVEDVRELNEDSHRVVAVTNHARRLREILADYGVGATLPDELEALPEPPVVTVLQSEAGGINEGFILSGEKQKLAVYSDLEIFGVAKQRRTRRRSTAAMRDAFLAEISPGDYVVHVEHGIGRFTGVGHMAKDEEKKGAEYLILQYAQGDKLYVPLDHLDRVTGYVAPLDRAPNLTRLGTQEWKRAKERAENSTREMAAELLTLYASREMVEGHAFQPDSVWQNEMEESFPFEETVDQLSTIAEVKGDMENKKPMDRLVCGDVGYGKTEIALRAAFKAVMDGKQVAVLVPTTVLAQQHYVTFSQRLSAYPSRVEVLSRFRSDKEQREILEGLADGKVDICIGTHRLIQKDVQFKDLGLVVVDEEQRFGVAHKERLKQMRQEVDVLTLTATPIPRTLHMSMAGVRDMSTMETPPEERLPIKTYVSEFSDELIREAILRELDRQGQVYFLHNRVHNIDYMAQYVNRLVPEARIGVGHGQMAEGELENVMMEFAEGKMDVLMCTTIIESGLDIPNVNTLIINRADSFGLSQLYQLRGRVGRSARRAYAYLLIPPAKGLTEAAEKRLKAMLAATELGAGFRIAMKDLEIRGAGNILGAEQSGQIHAVGFDLYTRLLSNAVEELRAMRESGQQSAAADENGADMSNILPAGSLPGAKALSVEPEYGTAVEVGIPASVPEDYIDDLSTRLGIYQRLVQLKGTEQVDDMEDELRDRFGPVPWQVENLFYVVKLKLLAKTAHIESINRDRDKIVLRFSGDIGGAKRAMQRTLGRNYEVGNNQIRMSLENLDAEWEKPLMEGVKQLADFMNQMATAGMAAVR